MRAKATPPARTQRLSSKRRRELLLSAALKVVGEHGLEAANHGLVAAEAGVSVPLCFFYFKTREALIDAVLGEVESLYKAAFELAVDDTLDAPVALKKASDMLVATIDDGLGRTQIFLEWSALVRSPIWTRFLRLHRHIVGVLSGVIARGQRQGFFRADMDPEAGAELLHAASFGMAQLRMAGADDARIHRFQQSMMRMIQVEPQVSAKRLAAGSKSSTVAARGTRAVRPSKIKKRSVDVDH
jgi:TetR/AcrR family transcriptional regulator, hemagglutinin/protease regulatory protein